jgi:hypothetical protein
MGIGNKQAPHYSMLIEWSGVDQAYIVSLPEMGARSRASACAWRKLC